VEISPKQYLSMKLYEQASKRENHYRVRNSSTDSHLVSETKRDGTALFYLPD
jgi:hypothetical protein